MEGKKRLTVNFDQVRIYRHRKCDETEIRTGSSDNNSLRDESSSFDRVPGRSSESQYGRKKGSDVKLELKKKGLSFKNDQGEKHTNKTNKRGSHIRSIPSYWSEKSRRIKRSKNEIIGKKRRTQDKVVASMNRYNLRPRGGREVESQPAMEMKREQGGPVRSRKGRGRKDNPYIEERNKMRQQEFQTERVTYLEVYVENSGLSSNLVLIFICTKDKKTVEKAEEL
ncbi:uncharacterized protein TNCV_1197061 [Trichonephila clavipes]|uniref:Uncharacterized protein n=1 Tax=Trichonephila clavipes TaxID=2585209 RepID=A0A8X6S6S9_TRICX|nr:uncharacterized protein TNCV_1197061 [Trichonephila clavipes]